jgi:hypothetical protein
MGRKQLEEDIAQMTREAGRDHGPGPLPRVCRLVHKVVLVAAPVSIESLRDASRSSEDDIGSKPMSRPYLQGPLRGLWLALAASLTLLTCLKVGTWLRSPSLYEGDRMEARVCRQCGGKGADPQFAREVPEVGDRCPFCRGSGRVDVVIPGPNHPVRVIGVLVDEMMTAPEDTYTVWTIERMDADPLDPEPRHGVIQGGRVRFAGKVTQEVETGGHGLVTAELPPGAYVVTAGKEGYEETRGQLVVQRLTEPIWQEHAEMVQEPESAADARGLYGVQLLVTLGRKGSQPGRVVPGESAPVP